VLKVVHHEVFTDEYAVPRNHRILVEDEQSVLEGEPLAQYGDRAIEATNAGRVFVEMPAVLITPPDSTYPVELSLPANYRPLVENGEEIAEGLRRNPGTVRNPLIVLANYFFDSIPQDAFYTEGGRLYESLVTVTSPNQESLAF
jgi:hypothetical protein